MKHAVFALAVGLALCAAAEAQWPPQPSGIYNLVGGGAGSMDQLNFHPATEVVEYWATSEGPPPHRYLYSEANYDPFFWWDKYEGEGVFVDSLGSVWLIVHSHGDIYDVHNPHTGTWQTMTPQ